jgi:hypothetical protein
MLCTSSCATLIAAYTHLPGGQHLVGKDWGHSSQAACHVLLCQAHGELQMSVPCSRLSLLKILIAALYCQYCYVLSGLKYGLYTNHLLDYDSHPQHLLSTHMLAPCTHPRPPPTSSTLFDRCR